MQSFKSIFTLTVKPDLRKSGWLSPFGPIAIQTQSITLGSNFFTNLTSPGDIARVESVVAIDARVRQSEVRQVTRRPR